MKKVLITVLLATITTVVSAQVYKGQWLVGGNASFTSTSIEDVDGSTTTITLSPNAGYFFINNLAGGVRLSLSSFKEEGDDAFTMFSASPFVRYYFLPPAQKVNVFADGSFGFGSVGSDDKEAFNQWSIMAGPAIFLTPSAALEFALAYTSQGGSAFNDVRVNTFGVNVGFQIHLGSKK